jgi:hypothetical protein
MIEPMDIRKAIVKRLDEMGESSYWLAKLMVKKKVCSEQHVYRYLRGDQDVSGKILGWMLDALGLQLKAARGRK